MDKTKLHNLLTDVGFEVDYLLNGCIFAYEMYYLQDNYKVHIRHDSPRTLNSHFLFTLYLNNKTFKEWANQTESDEIIDFIKPIIRDKNIEKCLESL